MELPEIDDETFARRRAEAELGTLVILNATERFVGTPEQMAIIVEHGRRNVALQAAGLLPVFFRVSGDDRVGGAGIFAADPDRVREILADDPAIAAGLLVPAIYAGSALTAPRR